MIKLRTLMVLLFGLALIGCQPDATNESAIEEFEAGDVGESSVDVSTQEGIAKVVLRAYGRRDLESLSDFSLAMNREFFAEIAQQGEDHPRYDSIFKGWRFEAVEAWDGEMGETRYRDESTAVVKFHEMNESEVAVVVLEKNENGYWRFEDINSPARSEFDSLSTKP